MGLGRVDDDRVAERAESLSLGYLADDVVVATFEYPELRENSKVAVDRFAEILDKFASVQDEVFALLAQPTQMRMGALEDSFEVVKYVISGPDSHKRAAKVRDAALAISTRNASDFHLTMVRNCAESLARITLDRLLAMNQRGPWTSQTLTSS